MFLAITAVSFFTDRYMVFTRKLTFSLSCAIHGSRFTQLYILIYVLFLQMIFFSEFTLSMLNFFLEFSSRGVVCFTFI